MRSIAVSILAVFLACFALQATPVMLPDGIPLSVLDPGIGRPIIGIPGSSWDVWGNDNWANTGPGIHGDFDFNDGHGTIQFLLSGVAQWLGSNAGDINEFIVQGIPILGSSPGPVNFSYTPNAELIVQFRDLTTGRTYFSGPASRNPDCAPHVWTEQQAPEPSTFLFAGFGLVGLGLWRRRR